MDVKIHVTDRQGKEQIISGPTDVSLNLMELLKVHEYPAINIFQENNVDPWFAQTILLIESPRMKS